MTVNIVGENQRKHVNVGIAGSTLRLMVDTGADITIISMEAWRKLGKPSLQPATMKAKTASGGRLDISGECKAVVALRQEMKQCVATESRNNLKEVSESIFPRVGTLH